MSQMRMSFKCSGTAENWWGLCNLRTKKKWALLFIGTTEEGAKTPVEECTCDVSRNEFLFFLCTGMAWVECNDYMDLRVALN